MSIAQNWLQALAAEEAMKRLLKQPKFRRWGYTCWADQYYVQKYLKQWDTPLMLARSKSLEPDQFESTKEDSNNESMSADTDAEGSGESGTSTRTETTTTANRQRNRNKAKHQEWSKNWKTNAKKQRDQNNRKVVLPIFWDSPKEDAISYCD